MKNRNPVFFILSTQKSFWNITKTWWSCIYFRIFCFEFIYFNTVNKLITIHRILVQIQTKSLLLPRNTLFLHLTYYHVNHLLSLYQKRRYLSYFYQYASINSYLHQILSHFYLNHYHLTMKKINLYQIQYPNWNIYTYQDQHF